MLITTDLAKQLANSIAAVMDASAAASLATKYSK
jgi:hypothetical protein